ncbi:MAG: hypothetical protein ACOX7R_12510 [Acetivibrionales bacterium]|jgi:hypothetical protein
MDDRKPVVPLIGANGNIFNLLSIARNSLISSNKTNDALEMWNRVTNSKSYNEALVIIGDYVEFGDSDEQTSAGITGYEGLDELLELIDIEGQEHSRREGSEGSIAINEVSNEGNLSLGGSEDELSTSNEDITKVDFTQELHITKDNIDGIMGAALEEGTINWYESISSLPTSIEKVDHTIISNGGTIFFRIQGEDYNRTFDKQDLIYGLLRVLPDCLFVIEGNQIDTPYLDYIHIDLISPLITLDN